MLTFAILAGLAAPASTHAALIVDSGDFAGFRDVAGGGVTANGNWSATNFTITWNITDNADGTFTYEYTLSNGDLGELKGEVSHFILGTSDTFTEENVLDGSDAISEDSPGNFGPSGSNPGIPGTFFGIKFDFSAMTYTLVSDRIPIWGSFYAKNGNAGGLGTNYAFNTGFGDGDVFAPDGTTDFTNWVPVPDTEISHTPLPGGLVLLGTAAPPLLGYLGLKRRARRKSAA